MVELNELDASSNPASLTPNNNTAQQELGHLKETFAKAVEKIDQVDEPLVEL